MANVTIFKEVEAIGNTELPVESQQIFREIYEFIYSGVWTKSAKTKAMLPIINESAETIAGKMNISVSNVLASRSQASEKLRKILGKNLHSKLLSADSEIFADLRRSMQVAITEYIELDDFFLQGVLDLIPANEEAKEYKLEDCKQEIEFLASFSNEGIQRRLQSLDIEKLQYLMRVLNKPNHYKVEEGSRVKNNLKFEILGQILYINKFLPDILSEYERLKEFAMNDHKKNLQEIAQLRERLRFYEEKD